MQLVDGMLAGAFYCRVSGILSAFTMMMKRKMMGPALVTSSGFTSRYVKAGGQLMTARWSAAKRVR
jgi:hypothetical protein